MPHIQGYKIIPLNELMAQLDKERVTAILSSFSSPMNRDVELFLKQKAVTFDTQSISRTHLVFTSYKEQTVLAGYFTLAYKDFTIPAKNRCTHWPFAINCRALALMALRFSAIREPSRVKFCVPRTHSSAFSHESIASIVRGKVDEL